MFDTLTLKLELHHVLWAPQEGSGSVGRLPRRRWSRRTGGADSVLMVKSMLDLRQLDSFRHDGPEEQGSEVRSNQTPETKTCPLDDSPSHCSLRKNDRCVEAGLQRTNQVLGSTISLQVTAAWVREPSGSRSMFWSQTVKSHDSVRPGR